VVLAINVVNFLRDQTTYLAISERFMEVNQESVRREVKEEGQCKMPCSCWIGPCTITLKVITGLQ
jgi:hypothetical protein